MITLSYPFGGGDGMVCSRAVITLCCAAVLCALGCSDNDNPYDPLEICDNGVDDNGNGLADCKDPQCYERLQSCKADAALPDLGAADQATTPDAKQPLPSALQSVMNRMLLPKTAGDRGIDLNKDGKVDNKLGSILAGLATIHGSLDVQKDLDKQMQAGEMLVLYDIKANSLKDATEASLVTYFGKDLDNNASDNFNGSETFGIAPVTPGDIKLDGKIVGGKASFGPGSLVAPIAIGTVYVVITLRNAVIRGTVSPTGIKDGLMAGAIPLTDVTGRMLPGLSTQMTQKLNDPLTSPGGLKLLKYFDKDKDGTITVKELATDVLIKGLLLDQPDVDTDGDGKKDAISVGIGFTSVPCKIQKN